LQQGEVHPSAGARQIRPSGERRETSNKDKIAHPDPSRACSAKRFVSSAFNVVPLRLPRCASGFEDLPDLKCGIFRTRTKRTVLHQKNSMRWRLEADEAASLGGAMVRELENLAAAAGGTVSAGRSFTASVIDENSWRRPAVTRAAACPMASTNSAARAYLSSHSLAFPERRAAGRPFFIAS